MRRNRTATLLVLTGAALGLIINLVGDLLRVPMPQWAMIVVGTVWSLALLFSKPSRSVPLTVIATLIGSVGFMVPVFQGNEGAFTAGSIIGLLVKSVAVVAMLCVVKRDHIESTGSSADGPSRVTTGKS